MSWDHNDNEFEQWIRENVRPISLSKAEMDAMYARIVKRFDEACDKIDREEDARKIQRLLYDIFGPHSYCIEVPRG
jgi:hypothetical protein